MRLRVGEKEYSEILITDGENNLLVSITDEDIIEEKNCKVVCVPVERRKRMPLTKSEEFAKEVIELADKKSVTWDEFMCSLRLAKEIIKRNYVSKQCLSKYEFPSQVEPPEVSDLFPNKK